MEHQSVLKKQTIESLAPSKNENFIDATLGFAGHASLILQKNGPKGKLLGIDQDEQAIKIASEKLAQFGDRVSLTKANFTKLGLILRKWPYPVHGILLDLGTSNYQLTDKARGFSFQSNAPLDMRMDEQNTLTAKTIVNKFSQRDLEAILRSGEEKFASAIAKKIVTLRQNKTIETTFDLVEIVKQSMPPSYRLKQKVHFATDTFRALRMAVNQELESLKSVLPQAVKALQVNGRLVVITFNSLEDRIVKQFISQNEQLVAINSKPISAESEELEENPRSRSAKLRSARKI